MDACALYVDLWHCNARALADLYRVDGLCDECRCNSHSSDSLHNWCNAEGCVTLAQEFPCDCVVIILSFLSLLNRRKVFTFYAAIVCKSLGVSPQNNPPSAIQIFALALNKVARRASRDTEKCKVAHSSVLWRNSECFIALVAAQSARTSTSRNSSSRPSCSFDG